MQITPGQAPLSLAMLKALGSQAAAPVTKAQPVPASPAAEARVSVPEGGAPARHLPRGSFVDLRA